MEDTLYYLLRLAKVEPVGPELGLFCSGESCINCRAGISFLLTVIIERANTRLS